jgi:CPA2 family monovalent cation:H+ antiporter-2
MLVVGRRLIPMILHYTAHTGSRELFRLAVLAIALGVAFGAARLFGVSFALGAFFAGMILSESDLSQQAAEESLPLRDAFAVLFFVSVGMLFDPLILLRDPLPVLATLFIIVIGKSAAAFVIVVLFRHPVGTALTISASLAQIGEFSFILAGLGVDLGLMPERGRDLVLAGAMLSILLNPVVFAATDRAREWLGGVPDGAPAAAAPRAPEPGATARVGHTVIVGYGHVGGLVGAALAAHGGPVTVIEESAPVVARLHAQGVDVVEGNATGAGVLASAGVGRARRLLVTIRSAFEAGQIVAQARAVNRDLEIVARADSGAAAEPLLGMGVNVVLTGDGEIARSMIERASRTGAA